MTGHKSNLLIMHLSFAYLGVEPGVHPQGIVFHDKQKPFKAPG